MSWFDLGALVVVALAILDGARSGFVWALLEAVLLVAAALTARAVHSHVEPYVLKVAELDQENLRGASHVGVFAAVACVFIGIMILVHPASKRWRFAHDRWWGGAVGAMNGVLAALLLFSMAVWSTPRPRIEEALAESRLVPVLTKTVEGRLAGLFPDYVPARLMQLYRP